MAGSPAKQTSSHSKRMSMTVTPAAKNAAVMTNSKQLNQTNLDSNSNSSSACTDLLDPTATCDQGSSDSNLKSNLDSKRPSRQASLDVSHDKSTSNTATDTHKVTPKLVKRPPTSSGNTSSTHKVKDSLDKSTSKPTKSRASLTLRNLTSTLHPRNPAPSSLPKYKGKATPNVSEPAKSSQKRPKDSESDKEVTVRLGDGEKSATEDDEDADFVQVERPLSPLPRRAARKPLLPMSLTLASPSSPRKSVLHKSSRSLDSSRPKVVKTSPSSISRSSANQAAMPRPASAASQRNTPVLDSSKKTLGLHLHSPLARNTRRRVTPPEIAKVESSPSNPFQIPEITGTSLLSPPLSPFLEGASLDSIDANDVSALLTTVISPVKPVVNTATSDSELKVQTATENANNVFLSPLALPPQTPHSSRSMSMTSTDPRQSILSIQQLLEKSGDIDHLLSQPLPSIFTPEIRERLLSFGFSPGETQSSNPFALPSEPQTPSPVPEGRNNYSSISQILFPTSGKSSPSTPTGNKTSNVRGRTIQDLKTQLDAAQSNCSERDARIEQLEQRLLNLRQSREQEANDLALQVKVLEERIHQLLADKEREFEEHQYQFEQQLRDKDNQWQDKILAVITQISNTQASIRKKEQTFERRRSSLVQSISAWVHTGDIAKSELALLNANRRSIEVIMSGLDMFVQSLCLNVEAEPTL